MIIKNNHVVITNQLMFLCRIAEKDFSSVELLSELAKIDNLPDEERQKIYDEKENYYLSKPDLVNTFFLYYAYERDFNAKTQKYKDAFQEIDCLEGDYDIKLGVFVLLPDHYKKPLEQ